MYALNKYRSEKQCHKLDFDTHSDQNYMTKLNHIDDTPKSDKDSQTMINSRILNTTRGNEQGQIDYHGMRDDITEELIKRKIQIQQELEMLK